MFFFYALVLFTFSCCFIYYIDLEDSKKYKSSSEITNKKNLTEIIAQNKFVCVKVHRQDCPWCIGINAQFDKLQKDFPSVFFVEFSPKDAQYEEIRSIYNIPTVPAFIVFILGQAKVIVGSNKLSELRKTLQEAIAKSSVKESEPVQVALQATGVMDQNTQTTVSQASSTTGATTTTSALAANNPQVTTTTTPSPSVTAPNAPTTTANDSGSTTTTK